MTFFLSPLPMRPERRHLVAYADEFSRRVSDATVNAGGRVNIRVFLEDFPVLAIPAILARALPYFEPVLLFREPPSPRGTLVVVLESHIEGERAGTIEVGRGEIAPAFANGRCGFCARLFYSARGMQYCYDCIRARGLDPEFRVRHLLLPSSNTGVEGTANQLGLWEKRA